jgi:hypothetical protein
MPPKMVLATHIEHRRMKRRYGFSAGVYGIYLISRGGWEVEDGVVWGK